MNSTKNANKGPEKPPASDMNGQSQQTQFQPSYETHKHPRCSSFTREWLEIGWSNWVPKCGGCLAPRMTLRLLGSLVLVSGVVVSSAEGSLLVREEQQYQRCLLHQNGLVGSRHDHFAQPPERGNASDLSLCYPHDINLVRVCAGLGVILLVLLILCTILMFVAFATERWSMSLPWAYGCAVVILQEIVLVGGCWKLLGTGDIVLYAIHILLLAYSTAVLLAILRLVKYGEYEADVMEQP